MGVTVLQGDCREVLTTLPAESVQCCVTSPPYFGLRDYGTATWQGGSESCDHQNGKLASDKSTLAGYSSEDVKIRTFGMKWHSECGKCGAMRQDSQIGLEQTPKDYVEQMVAVFREIRRVLRKDGVVWLNLGDSYSGYHGNKNAEMPTSALNGWTNGTNENLRTTTANRNGIKPKDLLMIPARVAIALCDDGWYLRSEIVWAKPNPMPESVTDRPTRSHEMIYLLSKSQTYFYDTLAIREEASPVSIARINQPNFANQKGGPKDYKTTGINPNRSARQTLENFAENPGRNKRSVWTVATHPYAEAHFATFPEALIEPCILAGSKVGDTILDPFAGSGTTLRVATKHRRNAIGIELNPEYCDLIEKRTSRVQQTLPMEEAV